MKQTVDFYDFKRAFEQVRPDNFSREGLSVLWDYLEQYENDCSEELELDVIAICCDFSEDSWENIAKSYDFIDLSECETEEDKIEEVQKCLEENGVLVGGIDQRNLEAWAQEAEDHALTGRYPYVEMSYLSTRSGHTEIFDIPSAGITDQLEEVTEWSIRWFGSVTWHTAHSESGKTKTPLLLSIQ